SALHLDAVATSRIFYMEGYLAASPSGLEAALRARAQARQTGVALALTLSDMSMINFCRPGLDAMVGDGLDYLFCNEEEAQTWCQTSDLEQICQRMAQLARVVCLTRSAKGSIVLADGRQWEVAAAGVKAVDTNGAGDMFAGAFLYAVTQGHSYAQAAWLGNQAAGRVVSQFGNRLQSAAVAELKNQFARHLAAA
ncbi:MAG: PfkB family carbohydrate kinase, partial [Rhodoferax sp.]